MFFRCFLNTFLGTSIGCFICDYFYPEKKIKPTTKEKLIKDYKYAIPTVSLNLICSKFVFDSFQRYMENVQRSNNYLVVDFLLWFVVADFLFYFLHYTFHNKLLYKFHKIHHEFRYTYGITSIYSHPLDFIITNLFPLIAPGVIFKFKDSLVLFIIIFATTYTVVISHGGFKILNPNHLIHHINSDKNYGLGITDIIFNTQLKLKSTDRK